MTQRVFIVAPPRSGAGVLHSLLLLDEKIQASQFSESDVVSDALGKITTDSKAGNSHILGASDLTEDLGQLLLEAAAPEDSTDNVVDYHASLGLRVGLLAKAFPDAKFIHVLRTPVAAISSGVEAWRTGRYVTQPELEGWWGEKWSFGLTEGWQELIGKPLPEIVATQYLSISNHIIDELSKLDQSRVARVSYEALIDQPTQELERLARELSIKWAAGIPNPLPLSPGTISEPEPNKFKKNSEEVFAALMGMEAELGKTREVLDPLLPEVSKPAVASDNARVISRASAGTPFASKHTTTFHELLTNAGISLVVSTYKSGHVIICRADEGGAVNTAFNSVNRPMGIAVAGNKLAVGVAQGILSYVNQPGLKSVVEPVDTFDAVYAPKAYVHTGDISIHEMAYGYEDGKQDLFFINTQFSALCKQDLNYSFVPIWRPKWISGLAAEDRCHLNGLAMAGGVPKYVTALSQTDTANGWRDKKGTDGVIVDVETDAIIADGLSMPHSPRWHNGMLWVLESGNGSLCTVNIETGELTTVAKLPGFTRGLAFFRSYAFIGLSQVRESVFKELPVTEQADERNCGVWVVDVRTGATVAFLKFDGLVQEIFDVAIIPDARWPEMVDSDQYLSRSFVLDTESLKDVQESNQNVKS